MKNVIFCKPIFKTAIWGGENLRRIFGIQLPYEKTSEMWSASAHINGETPIIIPGNLVFKSLAELYKADCTKEIFGTNCMKYDDFPLLVKWIDANDKLSVQVHPDDNYAKENHDSFGKTEAWYIVSAKPDAKIVYGLKPGTTKVDFEKALSENRIEDVLNFVPVKEGDIFYIPSGMVHALLDGVVVYEVQQSSDITYRVFDWNRVDKDGNPRELHIEHALEVINFGEFPTTSQIFRDFTYTPSKFESEKNVRTILSSKYFDVRIRELDGSCTTGTSKSSFKLCSVLKGTVKITNEFGEYTINAGESFILPAAEYYLGISKLSGTATILEATVN